MMRQGIKRGFVGALAIGATLGAINWLPPDADAKETRQAREIVLVAREMAFYLDGTDTANPTLRFRAGERVRIVLRNEEPGVIHNFAVPGWEVATRELYGTGSATLEFAVPGTRGRQEYRCTPHAWMMRGAIEVQ